MKKFLLMFIAFLGFTLSSDAAITKDDAYKFIVTICTEKVYIYYDGYTEVGREVKPAQTYTLTVWADNPEEAEDKAKSKCSSMCRTNIPEKEGMQLYKGKLLKCESITRIYNASAIYATSTTI